MNLQVRSNLPRLEVVWSLLQSRAPGEDNLQGGPSLETRQARMVFRQAPPVLGAHTAIVGGRVMEHAFFVPV